MEGDRPVPLAEQAGPVGFDLLHPVALGRLELFPPYRLDGPDDDGATRVRTAGEARERPSHGHALSPRAEEAVKTPPRAANHRVVKGEFNLANIQRPKHIRQGSQLA